MLLNYNLMILSVTFINYLTKEGYKADDMKSSLSSLSSGVQQLKVLTWANAGKLRERLVV